MFKGPEGWIEAYKGLGAYWLHDGTPGRPHALLTSGNHSGGFCNSRPLTEVDNLLREAASDLVSLYIAANGEESIKAIDFVVGPQTGATKLAEYLSEEIGSRRGRPCGWLSPAKAGEGDEKTMVFTEAERHLLLNKIVLLCEDVITTGGSIDLTKAAVARAGGILEVSVLTLANRSDSTMVGDTRIIALFHRHMPIWTSEACPLCKAGSEAIRPKHGNNWQRLTAA